MGSFRKKGMERLQDSLLQDLERATTNLKNNPGNPGGWKLNRPPDHTIATDCTYSSTKVAKHYSPQYYVPEEPLYQNEATIRRSNSNASSHDYAALNGRSTTPRSPTTTTTPYSPMHEGRMYHANVQIKKEPINHMPINRSSSATELTNETDLITQKLSMLDSLLDDLNAARHSYDRTNNSPTSSHLNGGANHLVNGHSGRGRDHQYGDQSDVQVNQLIKDLEYNLQNTNSPSVNGTQSKPKTVTFENATTQSAKARSPSPTHQAQIQPVSEYNRNLVNIQPQHVRMNNNPIIQVPLGHGPASNATRELDDLMASLSDFKMNQMNKAQSPVKSNLVSLGRIQVPAKNGSGVLYRPPDSNDLDLMIGDLESDLNRQGITATNKGDCGSCGRPIIGQVVTALGKIFHPEHFTCAMCNTKLGNQSFFEREGLAYCEEDYHKLYSPRCNHCSKPILDRCITALDKTWHPEHFFCAHCGKNFGDDGYHEKAGNAYCREDFFKLFAPKCVGCMQPIMDNYVSALGGHWHSDCFVCRDCKLPFNGGNFFDIEGEPFCETHYHDHRGTLCASCRQPITGRCITAMFQKYHPEHFTCSFCLKQLNKGTFKKHQEKPYCHSCFDKLFA
ncbi:hypothetical protein RDWZM_007686 [Blomia tropicalis]|uniref:LIM zinc-binding domain-containing protein n=1 Tax=Blomia tropicalis TaxID=40697 RepID=A0A9Q0M083_BLOTA|nr:hypothetical protein RDWZM_007686 [Blomia tropicalis]